MNAVFMFPRLMKFSSWKLQMQLWEQLITSKSTRPPLSAFTWGLLATSLTLFSASPLEYFFSSFS